ncbi:hypothetical protein JXI42_08380 [bacterium]|nr:hypothetical protein [bacterium]
MAKTKGGTDNKNEEVKVQKNGKFTKEEVNEGKALAAIAYIPFLCFVSYLIGKDTNRFVYEHAKIGILLFFAEVLVLICVLVWPAAFIILGIIAIVGIIFAALGNYWKVPLLGDLAEKLRL